MRTPVIGLTVRQAKVLKFIENYQFQNGKSPTVREVKEHMKVSSDFGVLKHILALEKKGYIKKDDTPRGIKLMDSVKAKLHAELVNIPVLGSIPAGGPVMTEEYVDNWVTMDLSKIKHPKDTFMLRVTGNSMINAGIFEGDLLLADSKIEPRVGDVVIALVDNENTVKRLLKKDGLYFLQAENPDYKDIHPLAKLEVQGVVIGLTRVMR